MIGLRGLAALAWKESAGSRRRLFSFVAATIFGVAALVGLTSFSTNLRRAIDVQAKSLLGADLVFRSSTPFLEGAEKLMAGIPGRRADEISFSNMAVFPRTNESRLVQVRAVSPDLPFYGELRTTPEQAVSAFRERNEALIDRTLSIQFNLGVGDRLRIGNLELTVGGILERVLGDSPLWESIAPRVYIPYPLASQSGLLTRGSRVTYRSYFALPNDVSAEAIEQRVKDSLAPLSLTMETVESRKKSVGRVSDNVAELLHLSSFFALLLGVLGVASGAQIYVRSKITTAAILRALGARSSLAGRIFFIQLFVAAFFAAVVGALLGVALQQYLPALFRGIVPVETEVSISWPSILSGIGLGLLASLVVLIYALAGLRGLSTLSVLRGDETLDPAARLTRRIIGFGSLIALGALAMLQASTLQRGAGFVLGVAFAGAAMALAVRVLMRFARAIVRRIPSYPIRQGYLNLFRANNQSAALVVVIATSVTLTACMLLLRSMILEQIRFSGSAGQPNVILFDIQYDQREELRTFLKEHGMAPMDEEPVVTMRLSSVRGRAVSELLKEDNPTIPEWTLRREYRSTYRSALRDTEKLVSGSLTSSDTASGNTPSRSPETELDPSAPIRVSLEKGIAEKLGVSLGDELTFDVQGVAMKTVVGSIRDVDWQRVRPNFFVVFPEGVLEGVPQFFIFTTFARSEEMAAELQRAVVGKFPNVSLLDASAILKLVDEVLSKFAVVVQVIAGAVAAVSLLLLGTAVAGSSALRLRENALLKVLGARRRELLTITVAEYASIGVLAATVGALLSGLAGYLLATRVFEIHFLLSTPVVGLVCASAVVLVVLVGSVLSIGAFRRKPLDVLRGE